MSEWLISAFFDSLLALAHGAIISCVLSNLYKQFADWKIQILNYFVLFSNWKAWCWISRTWATWYEELTHWTRPWCWKRWKTKGEGGGTGWDGWMASLTHWTHNMSLSKLWVLQSMRSQRVRWDSATEQQQSSKIWKLSGCIVGNLYVRLQSINCDKWWIH